MKRRNPQFLLRLRVVFAAIIVAGFALIANLFLIQITNGHQFRQKADGQYVVATYNSFQRGSIYFQERDGNRVSAAGQNSGYKISINPSKLTLSGAELADIISSEIKDVDRDEIIQAAEQKNRTYKEIVHQIPKEIGIRLKEELGKNIQLHSEKWRIYPLLGSAAHVLGFLGYQGDEYAGRYGLERSYEETLKREDKDIYTNFFARAFHDVKNLVDSKKTPEGDIIASIDPQIQLYFENRLQSIEEKWDADAVGGIIMNPKNGEIYAMEALPSFDNNNFNEASLSLFKNPLVQNVYEMGSTMKPIIVALGMDSNSIDKDTLEYYDTGSVDVGISTISNYDGRGRGWVNAQEILNQSLNTGMVYIGQHIDKEIFRNYFKKFGFLKKTGIDLPNEGANLTSNLNSNRDIEFANISFGQGIAVTPISMIRSLSALGNGGLLVHPHLIKKIEYTNGFSKNIDYTNSQTRVISEETSEEITRMLVNVFDAYHDGGVKFDNYSVAAKTGTAQIPDPNGGYYDDRNLHSFFGYFPAYDPKFIILLYAVNPKGVRYASQTLIDPFKETAQYIINYYNIPPDR